MSLSTVKTNKVVKLIQVKPASFKAVKLLPDNDLPEDDMNKAHDKK